VLARRSCLGSLSRPERLVLTLRAGIGAGAPRTRGTVARRLRITVHRVARLERAGLKRLRAVCGVTAPAASTTTDAAVPPPPGSTLAQAPTETRATAKPGKPSRNPTPAASTESEGPDRGGVAGRSATNVPAPTQDGGFALWIPLLFLVCGVAGYFASRLLPARAEAAPAASEHWSAPPAGGVDPPPPAPAAAPLPAHKPPVDDPPPKLPSHRAPSHPRR
jgi:hypothetical protein